MSYSYPRTVTLRAGTVILTRALLFWENIILLTLLRTVALNEEPLHCQLSDSLSWENIILLALLRTVALNEELLPCQLRDSLFWENTILLVLLKTVALNEEPLHCQLSVSLFWENTILLVLLRTVALLPCQLVLHSFGRMSYSYPRTVTLRAGTVILIRALLFWENIILLAVLRTVALLSCQLSVSFFWENVILLTKDSNT